MDLRPDAVRIAERERRHQWYATFTEYERELWDRIYTGALARGRNWADAASDADGALRYRDELWGEHRKR